MTNLVESPIPEPVRAVLALFEGPLADLSFPGVDRVRLAEQVAIVEQRRAELEAVLEAVRVARTRLEQDQRSLLDQARQAHAYASVYAIGDPEHAELAQQIAAIGLDGRPPAAPKKRGRPPKSSKQQTTLTEQRKPPTLAEAV